MERSVHKHARSKRLQRGPHPGGAHEKQPGDQNDAGDPLAAVVSAVGGTSLQAQADIVAAAARGPTEKAESFAPADAAVYRAAVAHRGTKIMVSTTERRLRLILGRDTVLNVPVAIGMAEDFEYKGRKFRFETPTGRRSVQKKAENPIWTVPDWHYMEKAANKGLELIKLKEGDRVELADSTFIVVEGNQVGRVNRFGNFWP